MKTLISRETSTAAYNNELGSPHEKIRLLHRSAIEHRFNACTGHRPVCKNNFKRANARTLNSF